ncbi:MAG TPA: cupin domain-containing protein [Xanthobacteraceae bacterium]
MTLHTFIRRATPVLACLAGSWLAPSLAATAPKYIVQPVTEMKVKQLPRGPLYWHVENFPTLAQAKAAAAAVYPWNPDTVSNEGTPALAAEVAGKAWLFTLGPKGAAPAGGTKVTDVGPVPVVSAPEYLLRINYGHGAPEARTPVHSHPGSETFYVVAGRLGQRTLDGVSYVDAGHTMNGHVAGMPMEVFNAGTSELTALIMFVVDASKPFSVPAAFP